MNYNKVASRLRDKLARFSGNLCGALPKTARRFVQELIYGITARQSVLLSEVVRSLDEEIPEIKTENRLCRQLRRKELGGNVRAAVLREGALQISDDSLLILDISDISKKHAKAMENLATVHDGSTGELAKGYWTMNVVGASLKSKRIAPLYGELYSQKSSDFISENHEIITAISVVSDAVNKRGTWVIDRGGDRSKIYDPLLDDDLRFLVRMRGDRGLLCRGKRRPALEAANSCPTPFAERIIRTKNGKETAVTIEFGFREVRLPWRDERLWMVVVKGFGKEPMMLLTNVPLKKSRKAIWKMVRAYITRWEIEETIRFVKQSYGLENVRVRSYQALRNLYCLMLAVVFFATVFMGLYARFSVLAHHALRAAKRFFGIPDFRYYALADGISEILRKYGKYRYRQKPASPSAAQLLLL